MSEEDILSLIKQMESGEDVPDIPESSASSIIIRMWAMDRVERRRWHRHVKIAGLIGAVLAGGGGYGVVRAVPDPQPVVVPAPIETVALSAEERVSNLEPRVEANEGALRGIEDLIVDSVEWAGDALGRKRGKALPDFYPSMKNARGRVNDRREAEAKMNADRKRIRGF